MKFIVPYHTVKSVQRVKRVSTVGHTQRICSVVLSESASRNEFCRAVVEQMGAHAITAAQITRHILWNLVLGLCSRLEQSWPNLKYARNSNMGAALPDQEEPALKKSINTDSSDVD